MQIILGDYVGAILGLVRDGLSWRLNPLEVSSIKPFRGPRALGDTSFSVRLFASLITNSLLEDKEM